MKKGNIIQRLRLKGIPALLVAVLLVIIVISMQFYISITQDKDEAEKLMNRELIIVEQYIKSQLTEAEFAMDDLYDAVLEHLDKPDEMLNITRMTILSYPMLKAVSIAFIPEFYPEKGYWFEPSYIRQDNSIMGDQVGSENHDYTKMEWYLNGKALNKEHKHGTWSKPYIDNSQKDTYIMSLSRPLYSQDKLVAVLCLDIEFNKMKQILKQAEPYEGSICQLLNNDGQVLLSSTNIQPDDSYFTGSMPVDKNDMVIRLSCPEKQIYGDTTLLNLITFGLLALGMLLLGYIVQRMIITIVKLNRVRQEQQMMEREMRIAHDIQMDILRRDFPDELHATLLPMKEVGGDLYDFYQDGDTLYFIIGDVSGKGIPAAMMMAATVNLFRLASRHFKTPTDIVGEINHVLSERNNSLMFVTAFVGKIDMLHGVLTYCNAGHNPPVLNGKLLKTDPDIPLGYQANYTYRQHGALFYEGSQIVLYTDGITESRDKERRLMGTERLLSMVNTHHSEDVSLMTEYIVSNTCQYAANTEQADDMTLMCIGNKTAQKSPSLVITNDIEELQRVKPLVSEYCDCLECDRRMKNKIILATEEAVTNVINYAYPKGELGSIEIDVQVTPLSSGKQHGDVTITIADYGKPFDPTRQQPLSVDQVVEARQIGGLGIYLYQKLMDNVFYRRTPDGKNVLTIEKDL